MAECHLELKNPDQNPIRSRPYPMSASEREELSRQVKGLLEDNIIEKSLSPWSSPVLLVKKHDASRRLVVDLRKINMALKSEIYPTLTLTECITRIGESKPNILSVLDLRSAYLQCVIAPSSRKYTAFQCQGQQYQYKRLAYGLKISSGHFNYLVAQMLQSDDVLSASVINYVDDLLIFTEDVQSHQGHAQAIYGLEGLRSQDPQSEMSFVPEKGEIHRVCNNT